MTHLGSFPFFSRGSRIKLSCFCNIIIPSLFPKYFLTASLRRSAPVSVSCPLPYNCSPTPLALPCCPLSSKCPHSTEKSPTAAPWVLSANTMSFIITALHCSSDTRHHRDLLFLTDSCLFIWRTYPQEIRCEKVFVSFFCFCFFPSLSKLNYKANVNVRQR